MSGATAETASDAPYVGLSYYTEADAANFFGRVPERSTLIANMRTSRLTLLYAASGVGKSSVLRAGVAARLEELASPGGGGPTIRYVPVVFSSWEDDPIDGLVGEIGATLKTFSPENSAPTRLPQQLDRAIEIATAELDATLLIVLDQFEEYFLYHADSARDRFPDELAGCVNRLELRGHFLISIREDAYAKLGELFKGRIANVYGNYLQLRHLPRGAAGEAISRPLGRFNSTHPKLAPVEIEPELVEAVLDQVRAGGVVLESAGLGADDRSHSDDEIEAPYLQMVMKRLWETELASGSRTLRLQTLTRLGGAQEIVSTHLDTALGALSAEERDLADAIFHHLVTPSRTKIAHDVSSLAEYTGRSELEVETLLEKLSHGDTRIVRHVPPAPVRDGSPRFEVFHDVLATPILDWRARQRTERLEGERRRLETRSARLVSIVIGLAAIVVTLMVYTVNPSAFDRLELKTIDARFAVEGSAVPRGVVIVGIDQQSFTKLADPSTGSIPRATQARAISAIWRGRPKVIAEDIIFDTARPGDAALYDAIRRASGHVALATDAVNQDGETTLFGHDPGSGQGGRAFAESLGAAVGFVAFFPDRDGRLRHFPSSVGQNAPDAKHIPSLPVVIARLTGRTVPDFGSAWIDYAGGPGTIQRISFLDLIHGRVSPARFRDKVVLIGATVPHLDEHPTPAAGGTSMAGVEILANAASTAIRGLPLHGARGIDFLFIVLLGLVPLVAVFLGWTISLLICVLAAGLFLVAVQLAFDDGLIISVVYPLLALALSTIATFGAQAVLRRLAVRGASR